MARVSTNISLDSELKKSAQELFSDLGLDMTSAITLFLKQSVREQRIPFEIRRDIPNAETMAAMREYQDMKKNPAAYKRYASFEDAMNEVLEGNA